MRNYSQQQKDHRELYECNQAATFFIQTYTDNLCYNTYCTDLHRNVLNFGVTGDPVTDNFFIVGTFTSYGCNSNTRTDCQVSMLSPYGNYIWQRTFGLDLDSNDDCKDIRLSGDGFLYVVGTSDNGNNQDAMIYKIRATNGQFIFGRSYDSGTTDYGRGIEIQDDGGVIYMTGMTYGIQANPNTFILKMDDSGNQIWMRAWASDGWEFH